MDKQEIFKKVASVEEQIGELYKELGALKIQIVALMEENTQLLMENQRLREVQEESPTESEGEKDVKASLSLPKMGCNNIAKLYDEGFHICNVHYGRLRVEGDCLFCLAFLNKSSKEE